MLNKKSAVNFVSVISLLFSLSSYSDIGYQKTPSEAKKIEYQCGKKCFSIDDVVFEFNADDGFLNDRDKLPSKMLNFNSQFQQEMKSLKTSHKIKMISTFRLNNFLPNLYSEQSRLKVYVYMNIDKCDQSNIKFEIFSLSVNDIKFQKLECKKSNDHCIDNVLSNVFENNVLGGIREHVAPTAVE